MQQKEENNKARLRDVEGIVSWSNIGLTGIPEGENKENGGHW